MIQGFQDAWCALTKPEAYQRFMNYKKRKIFFYVLMILTASLLISSVPDIIKLGKMGGLKGIIEEQIPDFEISKEHGLKTEKPVKYDSYELFVEIDPNKTYENIKIPDGEYDTYEAVLIADAEKVYMETQETGGSIFYYEDITGDLKFSKEAVLDMVPMLYGILVVAVIVALLLWAASYFLMAYAIGCFGHILARFMKVQISFGKVYIWAVYAKTVTVFLDLLSSLLNMDIPYYFYFHTFVCMGYMYFVLKDYKENMDETSPV